MALESATFINQLVPANPTGADAKGQGDDHLRLIKNTLKNTFPNITGAVTVTQAQLNALATPNQFVVPGMIMMWSGNLSSLPPGWLLCNGTGTITGGLSVPDLRNRFIVGAGSTYAVRATGGTSTHTHSVTVSIVPTALSIAQIPSHTHTMTMTSFDGNNGQQPYIVTDSANNNFTVETAATGSGATHTHGASGSLGAAVSHLPPYYALGFIIKS